MVTDRHMGRLLASGRVLLGLRQAELAKRVGISAAYLSAVERGKSRASLQLLERLTAIVGLPKAGVSDRQEPH